MTAPLLLPEGGPGAGSGRGDGCPPAGLLPGPGAAEAGGGGEVARRGWPRLPATQLCS